MDWIKRNLLFVIGATVALLLMVGAGFYTWTGWSHHSAAREALEGKYTDLKRLTNLNPNPGSGKVDNIKTAREQEQAVRKAFQEAAKHFEDIPSLPEGGTNVTVEAFANSLSKTISALQRDATNAGVVLPPKYAFAFQQQISSLKLAAGSVPLLADQLGDVKALSEVLIAAKINTLDSIQRERVSSDDQVGPQTDYLDLKSETNSLAILTPYQFTIRCFTPELAQVLCGFASSPYGIIVKGFTIEPAPVTIAEGAGQPVPSVVYVQQPVTPTTSEDSARRMFMERYGGRYGPGAGKDAMMRPPPQATPLPVAAPVAAPAKPVTVLNEKQLKVTMLVQVVKLKS